MAWPFSRIQTYIDGSTPYIDAATLNGVQDKIIGLFGGTKSVKAVVADSTGDNTVTPTAGTLNALGIGSHASNGGTAVPSGALFLESAPKALGQIVNPSGTASRGRCMNIGTVTRNGTGDVTVNLQTGATNGLFPVVTPVNTVSITASVAAVSASAFRVYTFDKDGAAADTTFNFVCYGG